MPPRESGEAPMEQAEGEVANHLASGEGVCVHHWLCEAPAGESSLAVCKLCGASKEFKNWLDQSTSPYRAAAQRRSALRP